MVISQQLCLDTEQDLLYCLYCVGLHLVQLEAFVTSWQYRLNPTEYPIIYPHEGDFVND